MRIFATEEYGLRCLIQLHRLGREGRLVRLNELAEAERMTPQYVAKLLGTLRRGGLVQSVRGVRGGYRLARSAEDIAVLQVLEVLGGSLYSDAFCEYHGGEPGDCVHFADCAVRPLWVTVGKAVEDALRGVTVADLLAPETQIKNSLGANHSIDDNNNTVVQIGRTRDAGTP